jgi:D-alanyl-D-alanine carboxypeptidase/D-alanyl-D-alanine-endopeptidase (penicillin-binding protein 4)
MFGRIPLNKKGFEVKGAMPDPSSAFKEELISSLGKMGITFSETEIKSPDELIWERDVNELIRFESPPLEVLVAHTNMKSNNLYAEHLLRQIGQKRKGEGSFTKGIAALKEWCSAKGISTTGLRIKDGSGLSRANSVSTRFFVELLTSLSKEDYYESFKSALPVAGRSGSMRRIGKGSAIEGKMYAKTGYIEDARAYCGFLEVEDEMIVFSILANDYDLSASQMRLKMASLLELLAK